MNPIKKWAIRIWAIVSGILVVVLTAWAIYREMAKDKLHKEEVARLREGLNDQSRKNAKIIKDSLDEIKVKKKIIKAEEEKVNKMDLKAKVAYAKKNGY